MAGTDTLAVITQALTAAGYAMVDVIQEAGFGMGMSFKALAVIRPDGEREVIELHPTGDGIEENFDWPDESDVDDDANFEDEEDDEADEEGA